MFRLWSFIVIMFLLESAMMPLPKQTAYRDLNHNGRMDDYENASLIPESRAKDLLSRMTLAEKAGEMFHTYTVITDSGTMDNRGVLPDGIPTDKLITEKHITHFNIASDASAQMIARYNNLIQKIAEGTRLGIPVTLSTDPKNGLDNGNGATVASAGGFSEFPDPIGMATTRDTLLMRQFGELAAKEYRAIGITCALSPQADLSTEPRWARISGTFGEDAKLTEAMVTAYIQGFQGDSLTDGSVMCITKHFPGNGPVKDGWESHFAYGGNLAYPGNNLSYHLQPFEAAIHAGTVGIMMTYGIVNANPTNEKTDSTGAAFNHALVTGLLKDKLHYKGIVLSDWNTVTAKVYKGQVLSKAKDWGMENQTVTERLKREILAGIDQIGGEALTDTLVRLVKSGQISESLIDASVLKILTLKFKLGLFDHPYVDENKVNEKVGTEAGRQLGLEAQQKSLVLLKNENGLLPLKLNGGLKLYEEGLDSNVCKQYATLTDNIGEADVVLLHLNTPYSGGLSRDRQEAAFHQGRLDFTDSINKAILQKIKGKKSIIVINLERPAVIPEIAEAANVLMADFNVRDEVILQTLFGKTPPSGKLPFDLPSSMQAVEAQQEDVPFDTEKPLYKFGAGLNGY